MVLPRADGAASAKGEQAVEFEAQKRESDQDKFWGDSTDEAWLTG